MATLAELWDAAPATTQSNTPTKTKREADRLAVLQQEMLDAQKRLQAGDARAQRDIDSLNREMGGKRTQSTAQPTQAVQPTQESGQTLADLWESTPAAKTQEEKKVEEKAKLPLAAQFYNKLQEGKQALGEKIVGAGEAGLTALSGSIAAPVSALGGIVGTMTSGKYGTQEGIKAGQDMARRLQEGGTYQPRTAQGQQYVQDMQKVFEASKLPPVGVPEVMGFAPLAGPATQQARGIAGQGANTIQQWGNEIRSGAPQQMQQQFQAKGGLQSAGAAATTDQATVNALLAKASPELQNELKAVPVNQINMPAFERHVEADTLPVPVRLTRGQATQDVNLLSDEMNMRGKNPELANRFNEQNGKLIENMNAIRDKAAPDVYGTNHIENAETVINAYKALDDARTADISAKYKALEEAAGGDFPIDGRQFVANAEVLLSKKLKTDFLPPAIAKQLERYKNGEKMTFEQFEAMRTNLASEMRKAERSGDGNAKTASSLVRQALEDLPLSGEAEKLKPLANEARTAAKARFDLLKKDPAYDAAVNDVAPDKFINKYIISGNKRDLEALTEQLGKGSEGHQAVSAAVVNWLKNKAGVMDNNGNFSQAGYNKALQQLDPKLLELVDGETAQQLKALGNVARYTQAQPRGSYVNQSNTFVAGAKEMAKGGLEKTANLAGFGVVPIGTMTREALANRAAAKQTKESLKPGAGTKLSDLGK
jgi:hypothetical protein